MHEKAQEDERVMTLVELALRRPNRERETFLRSACGFDTNLFGQVWDYVQWEERMDGFLLDPLFPPPPDDAPFAPGDLLDGRFRIIREVAQGGMGVVYEAVDEKLDRRIALKCAKPGFHNRLPPEARNATAISHPNVCKIFEIHSASTPQGEIDFLTMEFLDGETLAERLARGPIPEADAQSLAVQLCAGLAEAHRKLVIHGDLKSGNVFVDKTPDGAAHVVITDFGLARTRGAALGTAQSGHLGGTPDYMAPELWQGGKATIASDMYALGVILHELIGGGRPLAGRPLDDLPRRWRRVVARCLNSDPAERFQSASQVADALTPVSRRWVLGAAAATLLAVASGIVTYRQATAPKESVRLALLPLEAAPGAFDLGGSISQSAATQIERLSGNGRVRLNVIPLEQVTRRNATTASAAQSVFGASHVIRGTLRREDDRLVLHVFLTDTRTKADTAEREFRYAPEELRYAPVAMAGMVSAALRLTPPPLAPMAEPAREDYAAGLAYIRRNSTVDRALPVLERAVKADADSPLTWAALAEAQWFKYYISQDRSWLTRTEESLRQAQNRHLDVAAVHRVAGLLRGNAGSYEQAAQEYLRAIDLDPTSSDAYRRLGYAYERTNQVGLALAALQKAVELEPAYFKVYQELGSYYLRRGDSAQAIHQFQKCVQLASDEPDAHYVLGTAYIGADRYAEAESELKMAIALGETPRALNNLAAALMHQEKNHEAISVLVRALERFPGRYLWWMNLGDAYRRTSLLPDATQAYRRSLELAEKEIALNPRDGPLRSRMAYVCARLGDRQRADSELGQAIRLSRESVDTLQTAVRVYEVLGRRDDALEILNSSSGDVLAHTFRHSDLADLRQDDRFQQLVESRRNKEPKR
jgi:tetratricopeptide (TPR) repeat protein